ncbi:MAG: hypothetical protein ACYC6R_03240 [Anaerolineales bacterium]
MRRETVAFLLVIGANVDAPLAVNGQFFFFKGYFSISKCIAINY